MEHRFDLLTKILAGKGSRREMLRRLGGLFAAVSLGPLVASCERDPVGSHVGSPRFDLAPPGRCKKGGQNCRENLECCSNFCDPLTATCACSPDEFECPETGICVQCPPGQVFNITTCKCGSLCGGPCSSDQDCIVCPRCFKGRCE